MRAAQCKQSESDPNCLLGVNSNPLSMHERVFRPTIEQLSPTGWSARSSVWGRARVAAAIFVTVTVTVHTRHLGKFILGVHVQ